MKAIISSVYIIFLASAVSATASSCRKKEKGNCYCKYLSGDRTHYDLTSLPRSEQQDSCRELDQNADAFAGECKLK